MMLIPAVMLTQAMMLWRQNRDSSARSDASDNIGIDADVGNGVMTPTVVTTP